MDSSSWKAYGKIDPELEAMVPYLPPKMSFADMGGPEGIRKSIAEQMEKGFRDGIFTPADFTGVTKGEIQIPTRDGSTIRALTYRPESGGNGPLYIYFHGGGWVFGPPESYENGFEILVKELGFSVLSVDYRLAPEHLFPTSQYDGYDSVKWAVENASTLGADPTKGLILGGQSAGGNLAAVATRESIDQKLSPPVTGLHLNIPSLVHPDAVPEEYKPHYNSEEEFKDALILDRRAMTFFYETAKFDPHSKYASPLIWPSHGKQHPATYLQVCGMDPLRDDALIYESILRADGVPTRLDVYPGLPHAGLDILPMLSQSKKALKDLKPAAEWLLSQKSL